MTEHNVFTKKHTEEVTQAKQTLLDELNLPPRATTFIRENKVVLISICALIIFSIIGRSYYIYYTTNIINLSSGALAQARGLEDGEARMAALKAVVEDHAGTGASGWASIALAKEYIDAKNYVDAITSLQAEISNLKADAPEFVLCQLLLAHSYEENGQNAQALTLYQEIATIHEFQVIGDMSVARVFEKMGTNDKAIEAYERAIASPALSQAEKDWLKDRIRKLSVT